MVIWINREITAYRKLSPHAKEAFIRLATCYEVLVRSAFRSSSIVAELEKLPYDSVVDIHIVATIDAREWLLKREKLSKTQFNHLGNKAEKLLGTKTDPETSSYLREIRRFHSSFTIGVIVGGKMGTADPQMSKYDQLLVENQTRQLVRARAKSEQT